MKSVSRSKVDSLKKKPPVPLVGKIVTLLERENAGITSSFSTIIMRFRLPRDARGETVRLWD